MLLVHIHQLNCQRVELPGLEHTEYTNGEWFLSGIHSNAAPETRCRFGVSEESLPEPIELPESVRQVTDIENALSKNAEIPFRREYQFAITCSFLLRLHCEVSCCTIRWTAANRFATISWGDNLKGLALRSGMMALFSLGIMLRQWHQKMLENESWIQCATCYLGSFNRRLRTK